MARKFAYILCIAILFMGCESSPEFSVSGSISGADGMMLYLEHTGLQNTVVLDSCVLDGVGYFVLSSSTPQHPDFYRLRIVDRLLPIAIDSTEAITITATYDSLPYTLHIEGSLSSLYMAQLRATARVGSRQELRSQAQQIIMQDPRSLAAYYAVFLKQNGEYIWNIFDPADRRMYQTVATSFHAWMPEYERTQVLYNQVMEVIRTERLLKSQQAMQQLIEESDNAFLDINLPDEQGDMQALSSLRGEVIVLDFSASEVEKFADYVFELRELYNKYHSSGLEIYSVSLDRNQFLWEQSVEYIPWTTVRLDLSVSSSVLTQYNVQSLPTLFLLDRKGNVQGRYFDFETLETDIQKYL